MVWAEVKLKDVCERVTVGHVGSMRDEYVDEGVPFLRSQNIQAFFLDLSGLKHIAPAFHQKLKKSTLRPGDVAIVRTGYPGTSCVIPPSLREANCADLVIVTPGPELNPHFLAGMMNSAWGRATVSGSLVGVAQQHFNVTVAKEMKLRLPPRTVQDRIASVLSAYDDLIENNNRRIKILEEMAQNLYREWFIRCRFPIVAETDNEPSPPAPLPKGEGSSVPGAGGAPCSKGEGSSVPGAGGAPCSKGEGVKPLLGKILGYNDPERPAAPPDLWNDRSLSPWERLGEGRYSVPMVDSALGKIPEGWEVDELRALCAGPKGIQTGPFGSQLHQSDYTTEGVPVVMPKNIVSYRISVDGIARVPEGFVEALSKHRLKIGDIVYGRRGDIGRRAFTSQRQAGWLCGTGCLRIRPKPGAVNGRYLFDTLGAPNTVGLIAGRAKGATMPNLNTALMASVPILLPPVGLQAQYAEKCEMLSGLIETMTEANVNLRRTRDLLLPKLISGEVEVPEAENLEPTGVDDCQRAM